MQHDLRDCGPACLASICRYYGKETSLAIVREITKTDSDGTNLLGLVNGATELGFKADALGGNFNELEEGILDDSISLPFIAHTIGDGGLLHFVVVYKLNDKAVLIADPARGKRKISLEEFKMRWSGNIVSLKPSATFVKEKRFLPTLRFFGSLVANSKGLAAGILCSSIVLALTGIAAAYVFQFIVDDVVGMSAQLEQAMLIQRLAMICLAVAGLFIFEAVLKVVRGIGIAHFSRKLDAAIILKSYNHAIRLTYAFFATRKTGEIISRFSDAKSVRDMLSSATFSVVVDGLMVIFGAIILWAISPVLTCIAFAAAALYLLVVLAYRGRIQRISQATMEANAQVTSYFKESIDGIETVKALNIEPEIQRKTAGLYAKLLANSFKQNVMNNNLNSIVAALGSLATIAILWVGVHGVLQGTLTLGELITFNALLGYFLSPIGSLIGLQPQLQAVGVAVNRLNDIMLAQSEDAGFNSSALDNSNNNVENNTEDFSGDDLLQASKFCNDISLGKSDRLDKMYAKDLSLIGDIVFSNVCFRYGNRDLTLDNVSLTIKLGQKVAIVGQSGSG
ncbi:MAG: peptidase domain-containing ABC transporter, partial [Coriobacteriales bacterium]|nr:peptidase domain-containing ABC transporter [Coriobacteriales bacterium]